MGRLLDTVIEHMDNAEWKFNLHEEADAITTGVEAENGTYAIAFQAREESDQLVLFVTTEDNVPFGKRIAVAEFLTRANYGLIVGAFEMDMNDGEVRFRVGIDLEGGELTLPMVNSMLAAGIMSMDRYYPGLQRVSVEGEAPEEVIAEIDE